MLQVFIPPPAPPGRRGGARRGRGRGLGGLGLLPGEEGRGEARAGRGRGEARARPGSPALPPGWGGEKSEFIRKDFADSTKPQGLSNNLTASLSVVCVRCSPTKFRRRSASRKARAKCRRGSASRKARACSYSPEIPKREREPDKPDELLHPIEREADKNWSSAA